MLYQFDYPRLRRQRHHGRYRPYNTAMSAICDTLPYCTFVDNSETAAKYTDLWEPDQIHVQRDFYPHWATDLIMAVYNAGLEEDQASSETN